MNKTILWKMELNSSLTAELINHEEVKLLTPLLVYLAIIVLTGIPGNTFVFLVYRKNVARSNYQFFITWLAVIDGLTCCPVALVIFNSVHQYTFHGNLLCKFVIFFTCWPTFISVGTLCVIGIDRYRKVCKPHGRQISYNMAKIICAFLVVLAAIFSWPTLVLYGLRDINIHPYNVTGTQCAVLSKFDNSLYLKIYNGLLWILFMTALTIIVLLYIAIGKRIFQHARKNKGGYSIKCEQGNTAKTSIGAIVSIDKRKETSSSYETNNTSEASVGAIIADNYTHNSSLADTDKNHQIVSGTKRLNKSSKSSVCQISSKKESKAKQSTFIMFLISLVFIISFLPYLILRLVKSLNVDFINTMSDEGRGVYKFCLRSYLLNCAVNPFIYCVCSTKFRDDAKVWFVRTFRC